jgi:hypothetical protein
VEAQAATCRIGDFAVINKNELLAMEPRMERALEEAWDLRTSNFPDELTCYVPNKTLAVSLTGTSCALNCAHCGRHYLKSMTPVERCPAALDKKDYSSCLVSGGCAPDGSIGIKDKLPFFEYLKNRGIRINSHVGLIKKDEIRALAPLVDRISFDFIVHDDTIAEVFGIDRKGTDYVKTYRDLREMGLPVIPHICAGIRGGIIEGEYEALETLAKIGADMLVFIVLIPTPGTAYADRHPPDLDKLADLFVKARKLFGDISINLGCMRPKGRYRSELDVLAVKCGFNGIVNPSPKARNLAKSRGLALVKKWECCAL